MNPLGSWSTLLERLSRASGQQLALRGVAGGATVGFLVAVVAAGGSFRVDVGVVVALLGLVVMLLPDSHVPLFLVLALAWLWTASVPDPVGAWTLVAALLLLVLHVACTVASYGPPQLTVDPVLLGLWAGRVTALASVTALVWLAARLATTLDLGRSALLTAVALALLLLWTGYLSSRLVTREGD